MNEAASIIHFEHAQIMAKGELICSFCGRPKAKERILIGEFGKPHICSQCVLKCNDLIKCNGK